jgi:hypothetical protein
VLGGFAAVGLLVGAVALSRHGSGLRMPRPTISSQTKVTLPSGLQAPFDKLQHEVDK